MTNKDVYMAILIQEHQARREAHRQKMLLLAPVCKNCHNDDIEDAEDLGEYYSDFDRCAACGEWMCLSCTEQKEESGYHLDNGTFVCSECRANALRAYIAAQQK